MSISSSLSNAISGMTAASRMAEVVSTNVANSLTDGYGRRSLELSAATYGLQGGGVQVDGVVRNVDPNVLASRRLVDASLGNASYLSDAVSDVQNIVGSIGEEGSISSRIVAVEAALVDATNDPSSEIGLSALGSRLGDLTNSLNVASDSLQAKRVEADQSISAQVDLLNTALAQVEELNKDIVTARNSGVDTSSLMDTRQQVIDGIAEIVPIRQLQRDAGRVALITTAGETLIDGKAKTFGFAENTFITADMTLESGALGSVTLDGEAIGVDGFGGLSGGSLAAAFQVRDGDLVEVQNSLDELSADLITRFQDPSVDGTLAAGDAGVLTDGGIAYDASNLVGLSSRISVNANIDPAQGGVLSNLRDGVNATTVGNSGDGALLTMLSAALTDPRASGLDTTLQSAAGRAATLEASVGSLGLSYDADLSFETSRWSTLKEAEAADGVDTDYELQMLLRVETAYAANARVIQTVDTLMQRLLEL